jgi:hypothetical protein
MHALTGGCFILPHDTQEGCYEYIHPESGLRFMLGPMPSGHLDDSELMDDEEVVSGGPLMVYRPVSLGRARLPPHLQVRAERVLTF